MISVRTSGFASALAPQPMLASPASGSAMWYLDRGTGIVLLVLFTIVVVLGILTRRGARPGGTPVFVLASLHRNASARRPLGDQADPAGLSGGPDRQTVSLRVLVQVDQGSSVLSGTAAFS
jgi:hypothetical protein